MASSSSHDIPIMTRSLSAERTNHRNSIMRFQASAEPLSSKCSSRRVGFAEGTHSNDELPDLRPFTDDEKRQFFRSNSVLTMNNFLQSSQGIDDVSGRSRGVLMREMSFGPAHPEMYDRTPSVDFGSQYQMDLWGFTAGEYGYSPHDDNSSAWRNDSVFRNFVSPRHAESPARFRGSLPALYNNRPDARESIKQGLRLAKYEMDDKERQKEAAKQAVHHRLITKIDRVKMRLEAENQIGVLAGLIGGFGLSTLAQLDVEDFGGANASYNEQMLMLGHTLCLCFVCAFNMFTMVCAILVYWAGMRSLSKSKLPLERNLVDFEKFWDDPTLSFVRRIARDCFLMSVPLFLIAVGMQLAAMVDHVLATLVWIIIVMVSGSSVYFAGKITRFMGAELFQTTKSLVSQAQGRALGLTKMRTAIDKLKFQNRMEKSKSGKAAPGSNPLMNAASLILAQKRAAEAKTKLQQQRTKLDNTIQKLQRKETVELGAAKDIIGHSDTPESPTPTSTPSAGAPQPRRRAFFKKETKK